jgi:hypothetical protein
MIVMEKRYFPFQPDEQSEDDAQKADGQFDDEPEDHRYLLLIS